MDYMYSYLLGFSELYWVVFFPVQFIAVKWLAIKTAFDMTGAKLNRAQYGTHDCCQSVNMTEQYITVYALTDISYPKKWDETTVHTDHQISNSIESNFTKIDNDSSLENATMTHGERLIVTTHLHVLTKNIIALIYN